MSQTLPSSRLMPPPDDIPAPVTEMVATSSVAVEFRPDLVDRRRKRARVMRILAAHGAESLLLTSTPAINWYLDGARTHVSLVAPPIVNVLVTEDRDTVLVTRNEVERLTEEELPSDVHLQVRPWWESAPTGGLHEDAVATDLRAARADFLPSESARFARLCREAAEAVTDMFVGITPLTTERALAARVAARLIALGHEPLVVLVGGEDRLGYRHPLPTVAPLGRLAMVVVCVRRAGLIANLTRWVRFGPAAPQEIDAYARLLNVEAAAFAATQAGDSVSGALKIIAEAYHRHGFEPKEWTNHHQGGVAGYDGRDPRAVPGLPDVFSSRAYVAWNPSAPGAKVEDTVMITDGFVTPLTHDPRWPTTPVAGVQRPLQLEL